MKNENRDLQIEYDTVSNTYYIVWKPMAVIGTGSSKREALVDLKEAAHSGIDTIINIEIKKAG